jgi:formylmethanofuran dehydrogenase subunit E-like metal-binding protein
MTVGFKKPNALFAGILTVTFALACVAAKAPAVWACHGGDDQYSTWKSVGRKAATEALSMIMKKSHRSPDTRQLIALSNAGYAEINDESTMAALDGLSEITRVSRGANTLVEIHSAPRVPLWFAVFDKKSGYCAYLQVDPEQTAKACNAAKLFSIRSVEKIDTDYLYQKDTFPAPDTSTGYQAFGGNEFRIVTIANAVAVGVPASFVRAFEFHDHYCPGVTSGVVMANFVKANFQATSTESWFVQGLQPWCKEDALMVLLNATPGKSGYAVTYPNATGVNDFSKPASVIYHQAGSSDPWQGLILGFTFPTAEATGCAQYTNGGLQKLCTDLWFLDNLDDPSFIQVFKKFQLPAGTQPRTYAVVPVDETVAELSALPDL